MADGELRHGDQVVEFVVRFKLNFASSVLVIQVGRLTRSPVGSLWLGDPCEDSCFSLQHQD